MDKLQAYQDFWSSFGLPVYDENTVPDKAATPYITYEAATDDFDTVIPLSASIWYTSSSWAAITQKAEEIAAEIGRGGYIVRYDDGAFWITKNTPFAQRMGDPDNDSIRRVVLSLNVEYFD